MKLDFSAHSLCFSAGREKTFSPENVLVPRLAVAATPWTRLCGLLGQKTLPPGGGLLITRCNAIHTFFMRFTIDAVFLDPDFRVVKIVPCLRPWRCALALNASSVLELPPGGAKALAVGERLFVIDN